MSFTKMRGVSKGMLERLYHAEKMSQWDIARVLGVTQGAVFYWMKRYGVPARSHDDSLIVMGKSGRFSGEKNPRWNGGRHINSQGYVLVRMPQHPLSDNRGYVKEHRLIWYEAMGPIPAKAHIHHINGDKTDNRLENLEMLSNKKHRAVLPELLKKVGRLEEEIRRLKNGADTSRRREA